MAMDVGIQMVFASYGWSNISDAQVWDEELRLARLADELGFMSCGPSSIIFTITRSAPTICS
jgi:hypothetical protein